MNILAIETSCDETAAAVVQDGRRILSSVVYSQIEEHKIYGGVVPEIAGRRHCEVISEVTLSAVNKSGLDISQIDAIAVTHSPGLIGALLVGVNFAKGLSYALTRPLIAVHHLRSHIAANYIEYENLAPPFLCLVASGGHCHFVQVQDYTRFAVLGRTVDDAAGEAFDKVARTLGLGYPGGPAVAKAAARGNPHAYRLPTPRVDGKYDVSFSGLKTAVLNVFNQAKMKEEVLDIPGLAASFQYKVADILAEKLMLAATDTNAEAVCLAGGVAANVLLRSMVQQQAQALGVPVMLADMDYCGDNAAMIAAQGYYELMAGHTAGPDLNGYATMPMDELYGGVPGAQQYSHPK